ncbi:EFR1 family ferrodoxin [Anaerospora sp.]|uniref:EFR1 family ferrodoxin n=1 Tax=Anaerospora sp. TaxID=1960278 RepID=UPI00289FF69A|nr:EFR1 family ferrodoxin [Anaerospora sp.]
MYQKLAAFFMTGTGNSYRIADWSCRIAGENAIPAELHQIKSGEQSLAIPKGALAVFTYPTHGFTAPWLMMKYVWKLPQGKQTHALVMPSRAGVRVKGIFIPGLEGTAGYLIALLLWLRGYTVRGVMGVDMPSNWTAVHWGLSKDNAAVITGMAEAKVKRGVQTVLAGNKHFDGLVQVLIGLILAKISLMYLILAQLVLAKLFFASDRCNGCSLCREICPKQAIRMTGGQERRPYWSYSCDSCMACMNYCPQKAIEVSPLVILLFTYLTSIPVAVYAGNWLAKSFAIELEQLPLAGFSIQYLYILLAVAVTYRLLHMALGIRPVRKLVGALSHTRFFRRYQAAGVTLRQIHR